MARVTLHTGLGDIVIELNQVAAPISCRNFLHYVESKHYDGSIFHRVIPGFMIQGGGHKEDMQELPTIDPIHNEADNGLLNVIGAVAMARTADPHSASAQFFINTADNDFLNFRAATDSGWGYAVFARVVDGMDVVGRIEATPTGNKAGYSDVPLETIIIQRCLLAL